MQVSSLTLLAQRAWALVAARPRIRDMIRDATIAELLPEQPLVAGLDNLIEAASTAFLDALDGRSLRRIFTCKKAAEVADEAWLQFVKATMARRSRTQRLQK